MFANYNHVSTMWFLNREVNLPSGRFCIHASNICCLTNVVSCILFCYFSKKIELVLCVNTSLHFFLNLLSNLYYASKQKFGE